jgi:hypothetical protein
VQKQLQEKILVPPIPDTAALTQRFYDRETGES